MVPAESPREVRIVTVQKTAERRKALSARSSQPSKSSRDSQRLGHLVFQDRFVNGLDSGAA
jgi:hypothetical protein